MRPQFHWLAICSLVLLLFGCGTKPQRTTSAPPEPRNQPPSTLETVATFSQSMPTGVAVSHDGRIFVNYPRWGDPVPFTVAEIRNGMEIPFPNSTINTLDTNNPAQCLVSVQSVVIDPTNRLWILDTGTVNMKSTLPGGPKLVGVDLKDNRIIKIIPLPPNAVWPTSYLNDMRFDLRQGLAGMVYITDSSDWGPNGLIVVDLGTGQARRVLDDHPSTKAERDFIPTVEGRPLMVRKPGQAARPIGVGVDGIAISPNGSRLYYCALGGRRLYSVPTSAFMDEDLMATKVGATVRDEGSKPVSDGLESDSEGRLYLTDYENNAIVRREVNGSYSYIVRDPRILWPDTLCLATDGYLYFTANQLHRQPSFQNGQDLRAKPYSLFRVRVDASPVLLNRIQHP